MHVNVYNAIIDTRPLLVMWYSSLVLLRLSFQCCHWKITHSQTFIGYCSIIQVFKTKQSICHYRHCYFKGSNFVLCLYCLTGRSYPSDGCIESSGIWPILYFLFTGLAEAMPTKFHQIEEGWNTNMFWLAEMLLSGLINFALPFCRLAGPCWRSWHSMGTFTFGCLKSLCLQLRPCCGPCSSKTPVKNQPNVESGILR